MSQSVFFYSHWQGKFIYAAQFIHIGYSKCFTNEQIKEHRKNNEVKKGNKYK